MPASHNRALGWYVSAGILILALTSCTPRPHEPLATALTPPPVPKVESSALTLDPPRNQIAPMCKIDGCCKGHGEVSHVQPDFAIICTDGQASEICDCHN